MTKEEKREYDKIYREKNKVRLAAAKKAWCKKNYEALRVKRLARDAQHKEEIVAASKLYYDTHQAEIKAYREKNRDIIAEKKRMYDVVYRQTGRGKEVRSRGQKKSYRINTKRHKARNKLNDKIRLCKIVPKPCEVCGIEKNIHAHHDDYDKPLEVRWLCALHHRELHREIS